MRHKHAPRSAFTLLEVILALGIAAVLLSALYWSMSSQIHLAQSGRNVIEKGTLARALLARISNDITSHLPPVSPFLESYTGSSSSATSGSDPNADPSTAPAAGDASTMPVGDAYAPFNVGLKGYSQSLTLTVTKYTTELTKNRDLKVCDLRRIDYWLASGEKTGLARRQITLVTSTNNEDINLDPTTLNDQDKYIEATEVKNLTFRYWNGSDWQDSWDGTQLGDDNTTPLGPPAAIEITLEVAPSGTSSQDEKTMIYRHIVTIPTANIIMKQ
jgi:prepilin-type N-terminal cleavage/methylation domain-containing protein